jgi:1D-myo-inositol-tetrakisphosphate 5-kinase/inositol-polyphosphate multikinase
MSYQSDAKPMVGQVGGVSVHKRPLLTLAPDYVLKPLHTDHRGVREVCFYELLQLAGSPNCSIQTYAARIAGRKDPASEAWWRQFGEQWDAIAIWFALLLQDEAVVASERRLNRAWKAVRREMDSLRKLSNFTAPYYGVVRQKHLLCMSPSNVNSRRPSQLREDSTQEILSDGHLLLQDVTANFSKPCVMDLKMGTQSYEPDASEEKRAQEFAKYQQQARFGFRIVGMRFYDPSHPEADETGFRFFRKEYGRSLATRESVSDAFRLFFSAGLTAPSEANSGPAETMRCRSVTTLLNQLRLLSRWFDDNKSIAFYSSSLLVVYEGDVSVGTNRDVTNVKMIDFGRVRRDTAGDPGYKTGLRTLREIFTELMEEERHRLGSQ